MANIIEVILKEDTKKKFEEMDKNLEKIEKNTKETSERISVLTQNIEKLGNALSGSVNSGVERLASGIEKLNEAVGKMNKGSNDTKKSTDQYISQLNKEYSNILSYENAISRLVKLRDTSKVKSEVYPQGIEDAILRFEAEIEKTKEKIKKLGLENEEAAKKSKELFDAKHSSNSILQTQSYVSAVEASGKAVKKEAEALDKLIEKEEKLKAAKRENSEKSLVSKYNELLKIEKKLSEYETKKNVSEYYGKDVPKSVILSIEEYQKRIKSLKNEIEELGKLSSSGFYFKSKKNYEDNSTRIQIEASEKLISAIDKEDERLKKLQKTKDENSAKTKKEEDSALASMNAKYSKILAYENEIFKLQQKPSANGTGTLTDKTISSYKSQIKSLEDEIFKIGEKYKEASIKARELYDTKHAKQSIEQEEKQAAAIEKANNEIRKQAEERKKLHDEMEREYKKNEKDYLSKYYSKLGISIDPKTIEQYRIAIANLKKEIGNMPIDNKSGIDGLKSKMDEYKKKLQEVEGQQKKVKNSTEYMDVSLRNLAQAFGVYISVQSLLNFGKKVAEITGEFELQHRAMTAIIGDTEQANKLWEKTVDLAIKSPYRIKDLVTYTKQLAAYRIETDKLYETNKMLADISSGLGVDMNRMILAYGQVKAANYLRGQELRQFSEAGVNILGELANYFTELEGRAISTGEVFERVSKRMVTFEDVSTVLKKLTSEGGTFYRMQEIQSETIQGMIANMRDSFDVMFNEIGQRKRGMIVAFINITKSLAENWQKVANTITWAAGAFIALKLAIASTNIKLAILSAEGVASSISLKGLSGAIAKLVVKFKAGEISIRAFNAALKSVPVVGWIMAIASLATGAFVAISNKIKETREEEEKFNESTKDLRDKISYTKLYSDSIIRLSTEIKTLNDTQDRTEEQEKRLVELTEEREKEISRLNGVNKEYAESLNDIKDNVDALTNAENEELATLRARLALEKLLSEGKTKDIFGDYKKAEDDFTNARTNIDLTIGEINDYIGSTDEAGKITSQFFKDLGVGGENVIKTAEQWDRLNNAINEFNSSTLPFGEKYTKLTSELSSILGAIAKSDKVKSENVGYLTMQNITTSFSTITDKQNQLTKATRELENANQALDESFDKIINKYKYFEDYKNISDAYKKADASVDETEIANVRKQFVDFWNKVIDDANMDSSIKDKFAKKILKDIGSAFGVTSLETDSIKEPLLEWQNRVNEEIDKISKEYGEKVKEIGIENNKNIPSLTLFTITDPYKQLEDAQKDIKSKIDEVKAKIASYDVRGQVAIDDEEYKGLKVYLESLEKIADALGVVDKKSGGGSGNPALERLNKQISAIKEANSQYKKYLELFNETKSFEKVKTEFSDLFKDLGMEGWVDSISSFSDSEVKTAFEDKLKPFVDAAGKKGQEAADKFKTPFEYAIDKLNFDKALENAKNAIDEMFSDFDMGEELSKLGIGKNFAKAIFNVESLDFDQMRGELEKIKQDLFTTEGFDGESVAKWYEEALKRIGDAEDKQQEERLKKYSEYMKQTMNERATIMYNGLAEAADIEMTFQKEISKAQDAGDEARVKALTDSMNAALEGSKEKTDSALQKQIFEDFKGGQLYVEMFSDIDNTSSKVLVAMRDKLMAIRESMHDLAPTELKAINGEIEKINKQLSERSPFKSMVESMQKAFGIVEKYTGKTSFFGKMFDISFSGKTEKAISDNIINTQNEIDKQQELLSIMETVAHVKEMGDKATPEDKAYAAQYSKYADESLESLRDMIKLQKEKVAASEGDLATYIEEKQTLEDMRMAAKQYAEQWKSMSGNVKNLISTITDNLDYLGGETNNTSKAFGDVLGSILDVIAIIPMYIAVMTAAGTAAMSALGVIGLIAEGIQLVIILITAVAKLTDAGAQDRIEELQRQVSGLENQADRLERAFDRAFNVKRLEEYNRKLQETTNAQIRAYQAMIAAESSKKNQDKDQIAEWEQAIENLKNDIVDQYESFLQEIGGIGEGGYKDAAMEFVDAWYEAFKETGNGMTGLEEHFDEMIENMVKKQAALRIASNILEPLFRQIDEYGDDGSYTADEIERIKQLAQSIWPNLDESLKEFYSSTGSIFGDSESSLTGLQKGIQGVTEAEAEIIAAYMNSIRFYSIDSNTEIKRIANIVADESGQNNPMLAELRNIARRADDIFSFLYQRRENGTDSIRVSIVN